MRHGLSLSRDVHGLRRDVKVEEAGGMGDLTVDTVWLPTYIGTRHQRVVL